MNTRRYPRTMEEAFGPYVRSTGLEPMSDPVVDRVDAWSVPVMLVIAVAVLVLIAGGWL